MSRAITLLIGIVSAFVMIGCIALVLSMVLGADKAAAADGTVGIASEWGGPGAATHDCVWPWKDCAPRAVQSLTTGLVIIVKPQMYCDCFAGREGPNGETERLIDLDPSQVAALGLDPAAGLFRVRVWFTDAGTGQPLPDTAMRPDVMGWAAVYALLVFAIFAVLVLGRRMDDEPEIPEEPDEIVATIYERQGRSVFRRMK